MGSKEASFYADFRRGLRNRNLLFAESAARQLGRLSLEDALAYCLLLAEKDGSRFERAAIRWHARLELEAKPLTLAESQLALSALSALASPARAESARLLAELVKRSAG